MYSWVVTTTLPGFLSLPIQLGPVTFHSRRCTSTILWDDGPQWHLRSPRCDDNHQWRRHPWPRRYFWTLNMDYGLDEHLYSLTSLQNELVQNCVKQDGYVYKNLSHVTCDYENLCTKNAWTCFVETFINAWTLQECYELISLEHL